MKIETNLGKFSRSMINNQGLRQAAVAIVIKGMPEEADEPCILLTRRVAKMNKHAGQYALPGGKVDVGETTIQAALRELHEELGILLDENAVMGELDDYPTRSGFRITPVLVWANEVCNIVPSPQEVARVFHIPLSELDSDAIPVYEAGVEADRPVLCSDLPTIGHRLYSPTASIMYQFREVALRGLRTRVAHYDQPKFAWK